MVDQPPTTPSIWTIQRRTPLISERDCLKMSAHALGWGLLGGPGRMKKSIKFKWHISTSQFLLLLNPWVCFQILLWPFPLSMAKENMHECFYSTVLTEWSTILPFCAGHLLAPHMFVKFSPIDNPYPSITIKAIVAKALALNLSS